MASRRYKIWRVKRNGYPAEATANNTINGTKSGILEKKGRRLNGYKTYFFKINNLYLHYYASEADVGEKSPLGVFFLSALRRVEQDGRCINLYFVKGRKAKSKRLRATTPTLAQQWKETFDHMLLKANEYYGVPGNEHGSDKPAEKAANAAPQRTEMPRTSSVRLASSSGEGYNRKDVKSERTNNDGTTVIQFHSGAVLQKKNGMQVMTWPDGRRLQTNPNGTTIETFPDGTRIQIDARGVQIEKKSDGTVTQTRPDGTVITKKPDGSRIQHNLDGSIVRIDANGNRKQWNTDGTEIEIIGKTQRLQRITSRNGQIVEINASGVSTVVRQPLTRDPIPEGYYARLDAAGRILYFNIKTQESTYDRPRTAFGMEDDRKQRFSVLKNPDKAMPGDADKFHGVSPRTRAVVDWWARQQNLVSESESKMDHDEFSAVLGHFRTQKKFNWNGCFHLTEQCLVELSRWCPKMTVLDVSGCVQIQTLQALLQSKHCTKLATIKMASCTRCTDEDLTAMIPFLVPKFKAFDLSGCTKIGDGTAKALAKHCPGLRKLNMRGVSNLSDAAIVALATACQNLEWLNFDGCRFITDEAMAALSQCVGLTHLDVSGCKQVTDRGVIKLVRSCKKLVRLEVNSCAQVTNFSVKEICSSQSQEIEVLGFRRCFRMNDDAMTELCKLPKLRSLCIQGCHRVTDAGKATLKAARPGCEFTA